MDHLSQPQRKRRAASCRCLLRRQRMAQVPYKPLSTPEVLYELSSPSDDKGFWEALEEREDGRATLEGDRHFDTSYPWAV
jgi:hypothetical protein